MLKINFEFRKGIFFIRLIGNLNNQNYKDNENELKKIIIDNKFKYVVINTNYIKEIDLDGINYLLELFYITKTNESSLIICDQTRFFKKLLKDKIPSIKSEIEVL